MSKTVEACFLIDNKIISGKYHSNGRLLVKDKYLKMIIRLDPTPFDVLDVWAPLKRETLCETLVKNYLKRERAIAAFIIKHFIAHIGLMYVCVIAAFISGRLRVIFARFHSEILLNYNRVLS